MAESSPLAHSPTLVSSPKADAQAGERLAPGTSVGEYLIERFLGAGAMGEVYAGSQPVIGKKVAIKVLKPEVAASKDGAERFKREARAVNQIDHPNVIDIFSLGRLDDGRLYLVMDLVEGESLRKLLGDGPLEIETALEILEQIASALDAAHARGVIHRDLKPDNVMVGTGGKVYVLDFGLAKLLSPDESAPPSSMVTGQGTWLGTPGYMAPEQWSADGAGPASDRYSLGVMAFELLSGSLPFSAPTLPQMMEQHFRAKVPALSTRGAVKTSSIFDPVVTRAMAKDPTARFQTGKAMVEELRTLAGGGKARPEHARAATGRKPWVPAAVGAGVLGLSIAAVIVVRGEKQRGESTERPSAAPIAGYVRVEVMSLPQGADVYRDNGLVGRTPTKFDMAPGAELVFEIRKPGYATARHAMKVPAKDETLPVFELSAINGFEGIWALPSKELRQFKRKGEKVEVSKLEAINGAPQFFRHYDLMPSEGGVAFGMVEDVVDQRAPHDPSCHIPHKLEYQYDPQTDALVVRRERTRVDIREGRCVIVSSEAGDAELLTRMDRGTNDPRETMAPVGRPDFANANDDSLDNVYDKGQKDSGAQKTVKEPPIDQKKLDAIDAKQKLLDEEQQKKGAVKAPPVKSEKPAPPKPVFGKGKKAPASIGKQSIGDDFPQQQTNQPEPSAQNAANPPPQAPPPAKSQINTPANISKPRGDSQVAPPIQPQPQQIQKK